MGQSTDAYLFFGVTDTECGDWDYSIKEIAKAIGLELDESDYDALTNGLPEGLSHGTHCHIDAPMHMIYIDVTYKNAWRGSPTRFDYLPDMQEDFPELIQVLKEYAKKLGWEAPSWMIASNWS